MYFDREAFGRAQFHKANLVWTATAIATFFIASSEVTTTVTLLSRVTAQSMTVIRAVTNSIVLII